MANRERRLAARLLAGHLDQAAYQQAMADLAHKASRPVVSVERAVVASHGDPRLELAMLGIALPEVEPNVLCLAYVMARGGADVDTIVRVLDLTRRQAKAIVTRK